MKVVVITVALLGSIPSLVSAEPFLDPDGDISWSEPESVNCFCFGRNYWLYMNANPEVTGDRDRPERVKKAFPGFAAQSWAPLGRAISEMASSGSAADGWSAMVDSRPDYLFSDDQVKVDTFNEVLEFGIQQGLIPQDIRRQTSLAFRAASFSSISDRYIQKDIYTSRPSDTVVFLAVLPAPLTFY